MDARHLLVLAFAGCATATFHSSSGTTLPPIADRALVADESIAQHGQAIGTVDATGDGLTNQSDLRDKAALAASAGGGTHIVFGQSGVNTYTVTNPATETQTCTDAADSSTCTTTYVPESESTVSSPYATYSVYRVDQANWPELSDALRPTWDPALHTPSAVDGWGLTFGGFARAFPGATSGTSGDVFPTAYTADVPALEGLWISGSRVHGSTELAFDLEMGGTSYTGTAMNTNHGYAPVGYTGTLVGNALTVRVGKRITWQNFALSAGVGAGGALWMSMGTHTDPTAPIDASFVEPGQNIVTDLYMPAWTAVTFKPSCSWGVQGKAEYDVRPLDPESSSPEFSLGLIWQPAAACI